MDKLKTEALVDQITDFVNSFSTDTDDFLEAMSREHRTLQQSFTRLCLKWIEHCASDEYRYDDRNKASYETARTLIESWQLNFRYTLRDDQDLAPPPSSHLPMI